MKHHVPGLADVSRDSRPEIPDGVFLVRVEWSTVPMVHLYR